MVIAAPSPLLSSAAREQKKREDLDGPEDQGPDDSGAPPLLPPKPPQSPSGLKSNTSNDLRELDSREVNDYGYRYYHTNLGRWLSRDPIGERGGLNLYAYISNSSGKFIDNLGLEMRMPPQSDWYPFGNPEDNHVAPPLPNVGLGITISAGAAINIGGEISKSVFVTLSCEICVTYTRTVYQMFGLGVIASAGIGGSINFDPSGGSFEGRSESNGYMVGAGNGPSGFTAGGEKGPNGTWSGGYAQVGPTWGGAFLVRSSTSWTGCAPAYYFSIGMIIADYRARKLMGWWF